MTKKLLYLFFITIVPVYIFSQTNINSINSKTENLIDLLPDSFEGSYFMNYSLDNGKESNSGEAILKYQKNNEKDQLNYQYISGFISTSGILDRSLRVVKIEIVVNKEKCPQYIKTYKFDKRIIINNKNILEISYYLNDKLTKINKVKYSANLLSFDFAMIYLQSCLIQNSKKFNFELMDNTDNNVYPAVCELSNNTIQTMTEAYSNIPSEFISNASHYPSFFTYTIKLDGFIANFFPHKFYTAYDEKNNFIGFWGNDPKNPEFQFKNEEVQ